MNYWIISDTHFGHDKMQEFCGRPNGYEHIILESLHKTMSVSDTLIHLGDICIGQDAEWHERLRKVFGRKWLVRGNHDSKSMSWYLDHGWDFVADSFTMDIYGGEILFSHVPKFDTGYMLNIHGHFHNSDHRRHEPELVKIKNTRQVLVAIEYNNYQPYSLKTLVEKNRPSLGEEAAEKQVLQTHNTAITQ